MNIRVDHISKSITFKDDLFSSEIHPSSKSHSSTNKIGLEDDVVKLQSTPSELVRTQLTRLATSLEKVSTIIDPSLIETAKKTVKNLWLEQFLWLKKNIKTLLLERNPYQEKEFTKGFG